MVQINLSFGESTSLDMIMGFEMAASWWSELLTDDADVYFHVDGTSELPSHIVGGALPAIESDEKYEKIQEYLLEDVSSSADQQALAHLSHEDKFAITANGDTDLSKTEKLQITRANAKAIGLEKSDNTKLDGYILVSDLSGQDEYAWDFNWDRQAEFEEGNLDFFAVGLHEIGHLLGFVSGVDEAEWQETVIKRQEKIEEDLAKGKDDPNYFSDNAMKFASPLDLFRFSEQSHSEGKQDLSIGNDAYFSIDGGETALASFATGQSEDLGGDGYQASHWKQSDQPAGIMDPLLIAQQRRTLSDLDVTALDVIGWDIHPEGLAFDFQDNLAAVEAHLAARSGISVASLYDDPNALQRALTRDRTEDVYKMIKDSKVYEWGRRRSSRRSGRWQEIVALIEEEGKFQTIDDIRGALPIEAEALASFQSNNKTVPQALSHPVGALESGGLSLPNAAPSLPTPPKIDTVPLTIGNPSESSQNSIHPTIGVQNDLRYDNSHSGLLEPVLAEALEIHPLMAQGPLYG